jgi:organic radical activating enzyme
MCLVAFSKQPVYSALKKLSSSVRPAWAYLVICDDCSHRCPWCYGGFDQALSHKLSFENYRIILGKLKDMGVLQLTLAGGEPTEHPDFRRFISQAHAQGFLLHVATHGEHIDSDLAGFLKRNHVAQVQVNWQGKRHHDQVHGVPGAHEKATAALRHLVACGIETTASLTVGKYNLAHVAAIMQEAAELGVTRLRVWETTGRGTAYLKGLDVTAIFDHCREAARKLGYTHCLSYDPEYLGDVSVGCLQFADLYMYINAHGQLRFCGAVPDSEHYADFLDPTQSAADIRQKYLQRNKEILGDATPYCPAREGFRQTVTVKPITWVHQDLSVKRTGQI